MLCLENFEGRIGLEILIICKRLGGISFILFYFIFIFELFTQALSYVLEVSGTATHRHFSFLIILVKFDGLMMDFKDFFHCPLIPPWVGLQQHHPILTIRIRHQTSNL